jgi:hypothetical protein
MALGEKTMLAYSRVDGLGGRIDNGNLYPFEKLLVGKLFDDVRPLYGYGFGDFDFDKTLAIPLSVRRITTKTGKKMAFVYFSDGKTVEKVTIFSNAWAKLEKVITEYEPLCMRLRSMDDGGRTLDADGVINARELLQMQQAKETNG